MKPYQLSDELEKFLHDQSVVGAAAWNRLFDETVASLVFYIDGEELPLEAAANKLSEQDRDSRESAAREIARVLRENTSLFARVHNTLAKEKRLKIAGAKCPRHKPDAICPTMWRLKWSRRCAMPLWPPTPDSRIAIMR